MYKTAVCYFSGTGNSFDAALELCKHISIEKVFYIPTLDKRKLDAFEEIIIVSPVYQFNIPKNVQDFIRGLKLDAKYHMVLNGAGMIGKSKSTVKKLFKEANLKLSSIHFVQMPSSFTIVINQPKKMIDKLLSRSRKKIGKIARYINKHEDKNLKLKRVGKMKKYVGYSVISHNLSANSKCTRCQDCIKVCPMGNIKLYQGNIEFGDRCIGCLGCYNRCENIEYKGKSSKKYTNPNVDFKLMK